MLSKFKVPSDNKSTLRAYQNVWAKFVHFCTKRQRNFKQIHPTDVANFLAWRVKQQDSGSQINAAITALDMTKKFLVNNARPLAEEAVVKELRKTMKQKRPAPKIRKPREYFDPACIFQMLASEKENGALSNLQLRQKVQMLMVLDAAARGADLKAVTNKYIKWEKNKATVFAFWTKEARNQVWTPFVFRCTCRALKNACTFCSMRSYKSRSQIAERRMQTPTVELMTENGTTHVKPFFISHRGPKCRVSIETLRKDLSLLMHRAGVDEIWTPHDLRGAVASKLWNLQAGNERVLAMGRWKSEQTFLDHYFKRSFFLETKEANKRIPLRTLLRRTVNFVEESVFEEMNEDLHDEKEEH